MSCRSIGDDDVDRVEGGGGLGGRQEQPAEQIAIEAEERHAVGNLIAERFAPRFEADVAFGGQRLALAVKVGERLHLDLDHRVPPAEHRLDGRPPGRLAAPLRHVVLDLDELHPRRGIGHRHAVRLEDRRRPGAALQRRVQRPRLLRVADDRLDAKHILHKSSQVPQLLVGADQAIQPEDGVDDLVPDLLFRLDAADELVDGPAVGHVGLILDHVRDQRRAAPSPAIVVTQPPELARPEIEVGVRVEVGRHQRLHQRERSACGLDLADDDALERVRRLEVAGAQQLAETVELLFAAPDHAGERDTHVDQMRTAEREPVRSMGIRRDAPPHGLEIPNQLVDERLVGDEP